jgi:hypothetical protein
MESSSTNKRKIDDTSEEVIPAKRVTQPRLTMRPGGKGKKLICNPPEMVYAAIRAVYTLIAGVINAVATPGVVGGLTVYVKDYLKIPVGVLEGTCEGKKWSLSVVPKLTGEDNFGTAFPLTSGVVSADSVVTPPEVLNELKLTPDEKELTHVVDWLYGFYGLPSTVGSFFLLLSINVLHELGFILDSGKVTPILDSLAAIDPENIRRYNDATPRLLGLDSLPDVPGSIIYNPLRYTPAKNTVIAVRDGNVLNALINFTSPKARVLRGLLAKCLEYFHRKKAVAHALDVGPDTFRNTVVEPAEKGLVEYIGRRAIEYERALLETQNQLGASRMETQEEQLLRIRADKRAAEADVRAAGEAEKCIETSMSLQKEREQHFVTKRGHRLAILSKEAVEDEYEQHKEVNRPTQTMTHSGDNQPRVGCVVLKATPATSQDASILLALEESANADIVGWDEGTQKLEDINAEDALLVTTHISDKTSFKERRTTLKQCHKAAKNRPCASSYTESRKPVLTLLGGHNVITYRAVFREEMITFGGGNKRTNTLFAIPAGKLSTVVSTLKDRCEGGFAAGVYDGRVLFINENIMSTLPEEDVDACKDIIKQLKE